MKTNRIFAAMASVMSVLFFASCAGQTSFEAEPAIEEVTVILVNSLEYDAEVKNEGNVATATIDQSSMIEASGATENTEKRFSPTVNLKVELEKTNIEVSNFDPLSVVSEDVSEKEISEGTTLGKDVIKTYTFSDGQIATVTYSWRYNKDIFHGRNVVAPHIEINPVSFKDYSFNTAGNVNNVTLNFTATLVPTNATNVKSETITLSPVYTQTMVATEEPKPAEPTYRHSLTWAEDNSGKFTVLVEKVLEGTVIDSWKLNRKIDPVNVNDNDWTVSDTKVSYKPMTSFVDHVENYEMKGFNVEASLTFFRMSPVYNTPAGEYTLDYQFSIYNYYITFDNGEYKCDFKVDVKVDYNREQINTRAEKYPNRNYLGTEKVDFTYTDTVTGKAVYTWTRLTDLLGE